MRHEKLTRKWRGKYTLGEQYDRDEGKSVGFTALIKENKGEFTGQCTDDDTHELFTEPAIINGFIDNDMISFTKQYPYFYGQDENGNPIIDKTRAHP